jgi:hypothetical protein
MLRVKVDGQDRTAEAVVWFPPGLKGADKMKLTSWKFTDKVAKTAAAPRITFVAPCDSQKDNGVVPAEVAELLKNPQEILKSSGFLWSAAASGIADRAGVYVLSIRVTDKSGKTVTMAGRSRYR